MAGFDLDYSEVTDFGVEDGTYEVVIANSKQDTFQQSGNDYMQFDLVVRNDIKDQKFKNSHIFYRIFPSRDTGKFPKGMLYGVAKAAGLPDHTHFDSLDDYFDKLYHKPLLVTVKNEKWESKGKSGENLNVKSLKVTKFPEVGHKFKDTNNSTDSSNPFGGSDESIDISDEDLPF